MMKTILKHFSKLLINIHLEFYDDEHVHVYNYLWYFMSYVVRFKIYNSWLLRL